MSNQSLTDPNDKLREALLALDPENDEHWTQECLPRLDVLANSSGQKNLRRADLAQIAEGFTRQNPVLPSTPELEISSAVAAADAVLAKEEAKKQRLAALDRRRSEIQTELIETQRRRQSLQRLEADLIGQLDQIQVQIQSETSKTSQAETTQAYLATQNLIRAERNERLQALSDIAPEIADLTRAYRRRRETAEA